MSWRPPDRPSPPFAAFLHALDAAVRAPVELHCIGGFAVTAYYGFDRPTGDLDICNAVPNTAASWLIELAGAGTELHKQFGLYLQYAVVATLPYCYEDRLRPLYKSGLERIRLLVPDPIDLALTKVERNTETDRADILHLAALDEFDVAELARRYRDELRPYLHGPVLKHDATIDLWSEMITEE